MDEVAQARAQEYAIRTRLFWCADIALTIVWCALLWRCGWAADWAAWAASAVTARWAAVAVFGLLFGASSYLIGFPLRYLRGFVMEHHYALSNQTLGQWLGRELKQGSLGGLLGLAFIEALYLCIDVSPARWWLWLGVGWWSVSVLIARILPTMVIPMFYTCEPLGEGSLRTTLVELSNRVKVPIMDAFRINLSRDTKKANAAVVGWGKTRRVLMADTLLTQFTEEEVTAVVAHELGHHRHHHITWHLIASAITTVAGFFLLSLASLQWLPLGVGALQYFPALMIGLTVLHLCYMPIENGVSRMMENQADQFALDVTQAPQPFIATMKKLADINLAEMRPPAWVEWFFYSHPAIWRRITRAESFAYQEVTRARAT